MTQMIQTIYSFRLWIAIKGTKLKMTLNNKQFSIIIFYSNTKMVKNGSVTPRNDQLQSREGINGQNEDLKLTNNRKIDVTNNDKEVDSTLLKETMNWISNKMVRRKIMSKISLFHTVFI